MYGEERRLQNMTNENVSSREACQSTGWIGRLIWDSLSGDLQPWWLFSGTLQYQQAQTKITRSTTQSTVVTTRTICRGSSCQSPASHRGVLGSIPSESTSNLSDTVTMGQVSRPILVFPCQYQCSVLFHPSTTHIISVADSVVK